jgi:FkbM family methyltransferase
MHKLKERAIKFLDRLLPGRIKKSLFHIAFHIARPEFDKYSYYYSLAPSMEIGLAEMAKRGFLPKTIIDVGAFTGNWSRLAKRIWPESRLLIIEPNFSLQMQLARIARELNGTLICELLGAEDGQTVEFNVMGSGSSIMSERSAVPRFAERRKLRTLDSLLNGVRSPGFLKIDAQGYELQILKGALQILPVFEMVLLEIAVIEINEGAPLLHDAVAFMKLHGFVTYDILEIHRRPLDGALNQVDIVFVREGSPLISDKRHFS